MLKAISTITNALGALNYKGTWNASSNTPTLADGTGAKGDYYVVSTAGTQTFGGIQLFFGTGDWIAYNGAVWQRVEGGSDGNFANVTLTSTDAGATAAPLLDLYRDSASPAASDTLGEIEFNGEDSAGNKQAYGLIHASILSPTSTAEQGQLHFETATAGALTEKMIIGTNNLVINEIGAVFNVRIEGDTDANLFYTDATNSRVGIGSISPTHKLSVTGDTSVTGNVLVGATTTLGSVAGLFVAAAGSNVQTLTTNSTTGSAYYIGRFYSGSVEKGYIYFDGTNVSYTNLSDYRLKDDVQPMQNALDKIAQLNPVTYKWKDGNKTGQGFIAHELQAVIPDCVTGEKDEIESQSYEISPAVPATYDEQGNELTSAIQAVIGQREVPKYQGVDTSFLVATLTKAIQEQQEQINQLRIEISALKG